jgi:hypothetical protein
MPDWRPVSHRFRPHKQCKTVYYRYRPKHLMAVSASTGADDIEQHFRHLAEKWSAETGCVSSVSDLISHPSYQEIIKLGWDAVPYLLADLQKNKRFWFPALAAITKIRPFDPSDAGNGRRMTEAWVKWGRRKGLI